ncbi:unnamed protein product [marine sediment metagenome]|uniref:NYN domain-containing protein n=1 Tax=marine sediment metagenome TaxID=412755 RepID=X1A1G5_9ZZZZ
MGINFNRAIDAFKRSVKIDKTFEDAWELLSYAYGQIEEHEKEIEAYLKALEYGSELEDTWYNLGLAYYGKGDYEKLKDIITKRRKLQGIFLYEGVVYPMSQEKKKWYEDLRKRSGYEIKASFDKIAFSDAIEKKVDIKIAIDIISLAYEDSYDTAVLVSGDGDFVPVLKKVKELDKNMEVWAFRYSLANVKLS